MRSFALLMVKLIAEHSFQRLDMKLSVAKKPRSSFCVVRMFLLIPTSSHVRPSKVQFMIDLVITMHLVNKLCGFFHDVFTMKTWNFEPAILEGSM